MNNQQIENQLKEEITSDITIEFNDIMKGYDNMKSKTKSFKMLIASTVAAAIVLVLGVIAYSVPTNYVYIDINPSIELKTNLFNKVVGVYPANEDAVSVVENLDIENLDLKDAINLVVDKTVEQGFISKNKDNAILVTFEGNNEAKIEKLEDTINQTLKGKNMQAEVQVVNATNKINDEVKKQAKELGISAGKVRMINELENKTDHKLTTKQLLKSSVKDLLDLYNGEEDKLEDEIKRVTKKIDVKKEILEQAKDEREELKNQEKEILIQSKDVIKEQMEDAKSDGNFTKEEREQIKQTHEQEKNEREELRENAKEILEQAKENKDEQKDNGNDKSNNHNNKPSNSNKSNGNK